MTDLLTQQIVQMPVLTAVSPDAMVPVQEPLGPMSAIPIAKLVGRLIATDTLKLTVADLQADLAHDVNAVALVYADPTPASCGWWRKVGASGAGNWVQFEKLASAAIAEVQAAITAATAALNTAVTKAQGWAEGAGTPGDAGSKSSKAWANVAQSAAADALASGTVAGALLIGKRGMPAKDQFRPDLVQNGLWTSGTLSTGGIYDAYYYVAIAADDLPAFQVNRTIGAVGSPLNQIQFYSSALTVAPSPASFLGRWDTAGQTPVFTDLSPIANCKTVLFQFNRVKIVAAETYGLSIDTDFKILPAGTGSDKPRGWGRYLSKPDVQPMLNETIAGFGDSRFKNPLYNALKRIALASGMTLALVDANGKSDVAQSGRRLQQALYHSDPAGAGPTTVGAAVTAAEVKSLTQALFGPGHNSLFWQNPGLPTQANFDIVIGKWTDPAIAPAGATLQPSDILNAPYTTTMCSLVRSIVACLQQSAWNPQLKITWASVYWTQAPIVSGWLTASQTEQWLIAWRDQLRLLCAALGIGFFDWMQASGINQYNWTSYLDNGGIHMTDAPADRNAAAPSGVDIGMVSQLVQYYNANGIPKRALAAYENVP